MNGAHWQNLILCNNFLNIYKIRIWCYIILHYTTCLYRSGYTLIIKHFDISYIRRLIIYSICIEKEMRLDMKFMPIYKPILPLFSFKKCMRRHVIDVFFGGNLFPYTYIFKLSKSFQGFGAMIEDIQWVQNVTKSEAKYNTINVSF